MTEYLNIVREGSLSVLLFVSVSVEALAPKRIYGFQQNRNFRSGKHLPVPFFFYFWKTHLDDVTHAILLKVSRHCNALSFVQNWTFRFAFHSPWKSRKGDWIWAISGNNFNPKWPPKVDPWRHFLAGNFQSGRRSKQILFLESPRRPHQEHIYFYTILKKNDKWLNMLISACLILLRLMWEMRQEVNLDICCKLINN